MFSRSQASSLSCAAADTWKVLPLIVTGTASSVTACGADAGRCCEPIDPGRLDGCCWAACCCACQAWSCCCCCCCCCWRSCPSTSICGRFMLSCARAVPTVCTTSTAATRNDETGCIASPSRAEPSAHYSRSQALDESGVFKRSTPSLQLRAVKDNEPGPPRTTTRSTRASWPTPAGGYSRLIIR